MKETRRTRGSPVWSPVSSSSERPWRHRWADEGESSRETHQGAASLRSQNRGGCGRVCVRVRGAWVCGPAGAPLYVYPASVWVRQGRGWGEGRYFCPTASVSGGGEAPEEAASRSPAGPHPSSGVALRTWGRESPLFFGTGGQEMGLSPWGRWALQGSVDTEAVLG